MQTKYIPVPTKLIRTLDLIRKLEIRDVEAGLKEYHEFLDTLIFLHETLAEIKKEMPEWLTYSDTLMSKFYLHCTTFHQILSGVDFKSEYHKGPNFNKRIMDIPSAKVILRAQIETFLMYHHIYVNPKSDSEKELRCQAWLYSSMLERQSFPDDSTFAKQQKQKDKEAIEKLKVKIQANVAYKDLSEKQQKGLLNKGSDKLFKTWDIIIKDTGLGKEETFRTFYSFLSGYAHSEGLSIIQIKESVFGYNKHSEIAHVILFLAKQLICRMIITVKSLFKIVEIRYNGLPQALQERIEIHARLLNDKR